MPVLSDMFFFFFNDTATTEIYTLSLHDALPISRPVHPRQDRRAHAQRGRRDRGVSQDRVGVLRAVGGGRAGGRRDRARQEARAAGRGVARGRIWPLGDLLRRPVQAGAEGTGADPRGEARGGGTGGAEEISGRGEGNDGRGEALSLAPVSSCGLRLAACDSLQIIPIQPRDEVDRDL